MLRALSETELLTAPAHEIQDLLTSRQTTSEIIVGNFLDQIQKHNLEGHRFRVILFTVPKELALARARLLVDERAAGHVRGPLHCIPIIVKVSSSYILGLSDQDSMIFAEFSYV